MEVTSRVWNFDEHTSGGAGSRTGKGKYALWQPDQIVLTTGASQFATKALESATLVFVSQKDAGGCKVGWEQPLLQEQHNVDKAPTYGDFMCHDDGRIELVEDESAGVPGYSDALKARATTVYDDSRWSHVGPVYGSHLRYDNMRLKYNPLPPNLDEVRQKLFTLSEPLLLNSRQIADYWLHMTNVWKREGKPVKEENGTQTETWVCLNNRREVRRHKEPAGTKKVRKNRIAGIEQCEVRIHLVSYTKHACREAAGLARWGCEGCRCLPEWLHISRDATSGSHTHDLDSMDEFKRSDAILYFCKVKVEQEHWSGLTVKDWLHMHHSGATSQIKHVNRSDVANASKNWRLANRHLELKTEQSTGVPVNELRRRQEALDGILVASTEKVQDVLAEIFTKIPEACDVALAVLAKSAATNPANPRNDVHPPEPETNGITTIAEGDDISVPWPGFPLPTTKSPMKDPYGVFVTRMSPPRVTNGHPTAAPRQVHAQQAAGMNKIRMAVGPAPPKVVAIDPPPQTWQTQPPPGTVRMVDGSAPPKVLAVDPPPRTWPTQPPPPHVDIHASMPAWPEYRGPYGPPPPPPPPPPRRPAYTQLAYAQPAHAYPQPAYAQPRPPPAPQAYVPTPAAKPYSYREPPVAIPRSGGMSPPPEVMSSRPSWTVYVPPSPPGKPSTPETSEGAGEDGGGRAGAGDADDIQVRLKEELRDEG